MNNRKSHNEERGFEEFFTLTELIESYWERGEQLVAYQTISYLRRGVNVKNITQNYKEQEDVDSHDHPRRMKTDISIYVYFVTSCTKKWMLPHVKSTKPRIISGNPTSQLST